MDGGGKMKDSWAFMFLELAGQIVFAIDWHVKSAWRAIGHIFRHVDVDYL